MHNEIEVSVVSFTSKSHMSTLIIYSELYKDLCVLDDVLLVCDVSYSV